MKEEIAPRFLQLQRAWIGRFGEKLMFYKCLFKE